MENQNLPEKTPNQENRQLAAYTPPLLNVLEQGASPAKISQALSIYREQGMVRYEKTLAIPFEQRIPELIKQPKGRDRVLAVLSASILSAFNNIEKAKMSEDQILDLADGIIDSAHEDQLSIEDVLLFLKDLLTGKFGKISEKLDMPMFFDYFEKYRDKRYKTLEAIRYEQHLTLKGMGHSARSTVKHCDTKRGDDSDTLLDLFNTYTGEE